MATFWLDKSGTRVSDTHDVKQGSGAHYYSAFSTANQSNVRLGAENNNYSPDRPPCRKKFGTIGRMKTNIVEISPCSWGHEVDVSMVRKSPKD
ncbi:DUF2712 domain-containing protein, partial [Anoxybacillus flavithermus]|uniref:DUF2712 domain-containing protein n=1 Tax=Anoxybacillus flavithermus TaxID=33934 RepID=UPI0030B96613